MRLLFFTVHSPPLPGEQEALQQAIAEHRVYRQESHWYGHPPHPHWAIKLEVLEPPAPLPDGLKATHRKAGAPSAKVDYMAVLPPADFAVFSELRALRTAKAQHLGRPQYSLGTNEALARCVTERVATAQALAEVLKLRDAALLADAAEIYLPRLQQMVARPTDASTDPPASAPAFALSSQHGKA